MVVHKEVRRYRYMHSGDCFLYKIVCSCGEEFGGWAPELAEWEFNKHIEEMK